MSPVATLHFCAFAAVASTIRAQFADVARLESDLAEFLAVQRFAAAEKHIARERIVAALEELGITATIQMFDDPNSAGRGHNILGILPGLRYGTNEDQLIVLGANYDTANGTAGLDDNGSGVAAVLEVARIVSEIQKIYKSENSLLFVFFDLKHANLAGSNSFVSEVLAPLKKMVALVIILDGLLNFDPFPTSQATPQDFEKHFPHQFRQLHEHLFMGDFLQIVSRDTEGDVELMHRVGQKFRGAISLRPPLPFPPWVLYTPLPFERIRSIFDVYKLHEYLAGDHSSFVFHRSADGSPDWPTVYLTDTLKYRGMKQYCAHCDSLLLLTEQNLNFLAIAVDAVALTVLELAQSAVVEDIRANFGSLVHSQ